MRDIDEMSVEELEILRKRINQRLLSLRTSTGMALPEILRLLEEVKTSLSDQGKEWFSLERWQWMDGEIRFWLNPVDRDRYQAGWFSINELIAWSHDHGPVLIPDDDDLDDEWTEVDGVRITWLPDGTRKVEHTSNDN